MSFEMTDKCEHEPELQHMTDSNCDSRDVVKNRCSQDNTGPVCTIKAGVFEVEDYPPWYIIILCAIQQVLFNIGGPMSVAYIIHLNLCAPENHMLFAELLSTSIFMSGVATILQVVFGVRLPIVQGSSHSFIPPVIAMMATPKWQCPGFQASHVNGTMNDSSSSLLHTNEQMDHVWQPRLMELSGSLAAASLTQVFLGCTGTLGFLMNYIGPLTIIPTVALVGLSLFFTATDGAKHQWGIALLVIGLVVFFSLVVGEVQIPLPAYSRKLRWYRIYYPVFRLFPYFLALGIAWILCHILTITDIFPSERDAVGYKARTDAKLEVIDRAKWFFWPYPGRWGRPTIGAGVFVGMFGATITSIVESVGDYYSTARICGVPPPPPHAVNRGIAMEGFASIFSGLVGAAHATTSYSGVIGFIGVTGVRSRIVWIVFGILMMICGVMGKIGAALSIVPDPIIGGLTVISLGMVVSVALANSKHLNMSSPRTLLILAISLMLGMMIPTWLKENPGAIKTGYDELDQVATVLLSTAMFVGGTLGFILDNIVPGTKADRGLISMKEDMHHDEEKIFKSSDIIETTYDIPYISHWLRNIKCCSFVPFLPSYVTRPCPGRRCCEQKPNSGDTICQDDSNQA